jgi:hypothetical protein
VTHHWRLLILRAVFLRSPEHSLQSLSSNKIDHRVESHGGIYEQDEGDTALPW